MVEDDPEMPGYLISKLNGLSYEVELRTTGDLATSLATQSHFDLAFVDLELRKDLPGILEGIRVAERLHEINPDTAIVIYSSHIQDGEESKFPRYDECLKVGADAVYARTDLFSAAAAELNRRITEVITKHKAGRDAIRSVKFAHDLRTLAAVEMFGATSLEAILSSASNSSSIRVEALEAGFSGAGVFRVRATSESPQFPACDLVVKVSRSDFALQEELSHKPRPGSLYSNAAALPHHESVIRRSGLCAVSIPEVKERIPLRAFLLENGSRNTLQRVCGQIASSLLVAPARESRVWEEFDLPADAYRLKATALFEVSQFLESASSWRLLKVSHKTAITACRRVIDLIADGHWTFRSTGAQAALLHGDFHSRNVLVSASLPPVLIDFQRSYVYPRLFDFAALDADILLSVLDSRYGYEQDYGRMEQWVAEAQTAFPFRQVTSSSKRGASPMLFRRWLISQMVRNLDGITAGEYAGVLMFHLFRYLRFGAVANPKKVLACILIAQLAADLNLRASRTRAMTP